MYYYAVKKGREIGIFNNWEKCKEVTQGYSGAKFKSFSTLEEAQEFLEQDSLPKKEFVLNDDSVIAYVDGSFDKETKIYSYGCVFITTHGTFKNNGYGDNEEAAESRNVAGELKGTLFAVKKAIEKGYKTIQINYDYAGIECWATGEWQANKRLTQSYAALMQDFMKNIEIVFNKVKAHTGVTYNEEADTLAKYALNKRIIREDLT